MQINKLFFQNLVQNFFYLEFKIFFVYIVDFCLELMLENVIE